MLEYARRLARQHARQDHAAAEDAAHEQERNADR
jgi:hypothetical protein